MTDAFDLNATLSQQLQKLRDEGKLTVSPSKRCRICRDETVRILVNKLLELGQSVPTIREVLEPVNKGRDEKQQITEAVIRNHLKEHFDVQTPGREIYREILRRRAAEDGKDLEYGIGNMINGLAFYETVLVKAYATLMKESTEVSVDEGMKAGAKLHEWERKEAGVAEMAEVMRQMNRVISAVRAQPTEVQDAIMAAIEGKEIPVTAVLENYTELDADDDVTYDDDDDDEEF